MSLWWERFVKEVGFEPGVKSEVDGESGESSEGEDGSSRKRRVRNKD